jgi:hypothetical protein
MASIDKVSTPGMAEEGKVKVSWIPELGAGAWMDDRVTTLEVRGRFRPGPSEGIESPDEDPSPLRSLPLDVSSRSSKKRTERDFDPCLRLLPASKVGADDLL